MPTGIVESKGQSRSGKPIVRISGQDYYPGKSTDISSLQPGMVIEMDTASSNFRGTTYWYLNAWKLVPGGTVVGPPVTQAMGTVVGPVIATPSHGAPPPGFAAPAPSQAPAPLENPQLTRDEQIFCQAILKSLIDAKEIKGDIDGRIRATEWVQWVKDQCRSFP